jgi:TetR/AcrR family transcriptional regulator, transcriptional repressor for nem operon
MVSARGELTRSRILESTVDHLIKYGRESTYLDDVIAATSTSKGSLFHYFPGGKDELVIAATARQVERLLERDAISTPLDTWRAWEDWMAMMIRLHREQLPDDACEVSAMAGRAVDTDGACRKLVGDGYEKWLRQIESGIRSMLDSGLLRADADPHRLAITILASLQGGAVLDRATGSTENLEVALEAAVGQLRSFAS